MLKINNNLKMILLVVFAITALYMFQKKFGDHNLNKAISACIVAQKQTAESFDIKNLKKFCEEEVKKKVKNK